MDVVQQHALKVEKKKKEGIIVVCRNAENLNDDFFR